MSAFDFDFEKYSLSKEDFKDLMFEEIMLYHSDDAAYKYIKEKEANPDGALHLKYAHRLRKAYKEGKEWSVSLRSSKIFNNDLI